jgi:hypothetical protein
MIDVIFHSGKMHSSPVSHGIGYSMRKFAIGYLSIAQCRDGRSTKRGQRYERVHGMCGGGIHRLGQSMPVAIMASQKGILSSFTK